MPKAVERKIRKSIRHAHPDYSEKRLTSELYAIMNKQGLLNNSRARARGR